MEKARRSGIIREIKAARNRLAYKMADKQAISQLSTISKNTTKNIGFLRRRKEQLEFRIATEAFSVEAEKDLIRKKNEIEAELNEALKSFRLRKKLEFIENDIISLGKQLTDLDAKIKESDKKLDVLYDGLRAIQGSGERKPRRDAGPRGEGKPHREQTKPQEVSLADIAIMTKEKKEDKNESSGFDDSVLN